jgi:hypothetical protein
MAVDMKLKFDAACIQIVISTLCDTRYRVTKKAQAIADRTYTPSVADRMLDWATTQVVSTFTDQCINNAKDFVHHLIGLDMLG